MKLLYCCIVVLLVVFSFVSGAAFAQTSTPTPEPPLADPSAGSRGNTLFFSEEALQNTLPYDMQEKYMPKGSQSEIELKGARLRKFTNLPEYIATTSAAEEPRPPQNLLEVIASWFSRLFLPRTVQKAGFIQFIRPNTQPFTNQKNAQDQAFSDEKVYQGAVIDTERSLTPEGISFSRYPVSFPGSIINIQSTKLKQIFLDASQVQCVPLGLLLAISQRELESTFGFTEEQVEKFSTNNWQNTMTDVERDLVSCKNTCSVAVGCLPGDDVQGPMQFEIKTWNPLVNDIKTVLEQKYGIKPDEYTPDRCNLRDAIIGAAIKIKRASSPEADCDGWSKETVYKVSTDYCGAGACEGKKACGVDYCGEVWKNYQSYSKQ